LNHNGQANCFARASEKLPKLKELKQYSPEFNNSYNEQYHEIKGADKPTVMM